MMLTYWQPTEENILAISLDMLEVLLREQSTQQASLAPELAEIILSFSQKKHALMTNSKAYTKTQLTKWFGDSFSNDVEDPENKEKSFLFTASPEQICQALFSKKESLKPISVIDLFEIYESLPTPDAITQSSRFHKGFGQFLGKLLAERKIESDQLYQLTLAQDKAEELIRNETMRNAVKEGLVEFLLKTKNLPLIRLMIQDIEDTKKPRQNFLYNQLQKAIQSLAEEPSL